MIPLVLIGRGGHALACLDVIQTLSQFNVIGYVDADETNTGDWEGLPFLGSDKDLAEIVKKCQNFFLGIGQIKNSDVRIQLVNKLRQLNAHFPVVISPKAYVSSRSKIAEGTIVMHGSHVGPGASIGAFNILNTKSLLEHGSMTGDFVHISTSAVVNGDSKVGSHSFIGSNAVLCHGIDVPERAFIQAGQFVGKKYAW
jgi:sugar O-acyltransferase (sialic acid O-acetyltransferase NeuD family)